MTGFLQITINATNVTVGISVLTLIGSGIAWGNLALNNRFSRKADKEATEREFELMHEKINEKADRSVVLKMSEQIDIIYEHLINQKK